MRTRNPDNAFHLAIPCLDLDAALEFYVQHLGCRSARRYEDRITIDFFGGQLVCHHAPGKIDQVPQLYPRHFGAILKERSDFDLLMLRARQKKLPFFEDVFVRFSGQPEEHSAFVLIDPSNNLVEFKCYENQDMMY